MPSGNAGSAASRNAPMTTATAATAPMPFPRTSPHHQPHPVRTVLHRVQVPADEGVLLRGLVPHRDVEPADPVVGLGQHRPLGGFGDLALGGEPLVAAEHDPVRTAAGTATTATVSASVRVSASSRKPNRIWTAKAAISRTGSTRKKAEIRRPATAALSTCPGFPDRARRRAVWPDRGKHSGPESSELDSGPEP
ncbi:hypothetical protein QF037_005023 [Streptomyces canus]|nr:hypothetical protein [Streptomyces canus]